MCTVNWRLTGLWRPPRTASAQKPAGFFGMSLSSISSSGISANAASSAFCLGVGGAGFVGSSSMLTIRSFFLRIGYPLDSAICAESGWWGGPPGPRGTPSSRCRTSQLTTIAGSPCSFGCPPRQGSLPCSRNYHRAGSRLMFGAPLARLAGTKARKRAGTPGGTVIPSGSRLLAVWQSLPASPAHRSPILLLRLPGSFLLRFDTRAFLGLLFQDPPRSASALFPSFESRKKNRRRLRRRFNELRLRCSVSKRKKKKRAKGIYSRAHRSPILLLRLPGSSLL